ncbi:MAG: hypothetical protein QXS81_04985 [Candidatus Micrarchaeaceae archaeon]
MTNKELLGNKMESSQTANNLKTAPIKTTTEIITKAGKGLIMFIFGFFCFIFSFLATSIIGSLPSIMYPSFLPVAYSFEMDLAWFFDIFSFFIAIIGFAIVFYYNFLKNEPLTTNHNSLGLVKPFNIGILN